MKTIDYQHLDQGLGIERSPSFPRELQKGMIARFQAVLTGLIGPAQDQIYVIHGCEFTVTGNNYSMTAGAVFYNNRIYSVDAFSGTVTLEIPVFVVDNVYDRQAVYSDGSIRDTFFEQKLAVQLGAPGSGIADYNQVITLENALPRNLNLARLDIQETLVQELAGKLNWKSRGITVGSWLRINFAGDKFIITDENRIIVSDDGVNYGDPVRPFNQFWRRVIYGNNEYVGISSRSGPNNVISSSNAIDWNLRVGPTGTGWVDLAYGNGVYVAVGFSSRRIMYTTGNLDNWTVITLTGTFVFEAVEFVLGRFLAVGSEGKAFTSTDGATWNEETTGTSIPLKSIATNGAVVVSTGNPFTGDSIIIYTRDLVDWETFTLPINCQLRSITFGNNMFIAVGINARNQTVFMISHNGRFWDPVFAGENTIALEIAFGKNLFVTPGTDKVLYNGISGTLMPGL